MPRNETIHVDLDYAKLGNAIVEAIRLEKASSTGTKPWTYSDALTADVITALGVLQWPGILTDPQARTLDQIRATEHAAGAAGQRASTRRDLESLRRLFVAAHGPLVGGSLIDMLDGIIARHAD